MAQDTSEIRTGTGTGLLAFLNFMVDKGYATQGAMTPLMTASRRILSTVEGEDLSAVGVKNLDVDACCDRFETLTQGQYSAGSLPAYRQRFHRAIDYYRAYLADPNWRPPRSRRGSSKGRSQNLVEEKRSTPLVTRPSTDKGREPLRSAELISYPFPLKSGEVAQLQLPARLDSDDVDRLAQFIRALVLPPRPESGDSAVGRGE